VNRKKIHPALLIVTLILAACAKGEESLADPTANISPLNSLQIIVATNDFAIPSPRVPIILYDGPDQVADATQMQISAFDLSMDPPASVWMGKGINYSDYEIPYWVFYPEISHPGFWGMKASIHLADGRQVEGEFAIEVLEKSNAPAIGEAPPRSENRTLSTQPDLTKLTSAFSPNPALYQLSIEQALEEHKPAVVSFSTPGYCASKFCAPVLGSVDDVYTEMRDRVNFIHIEVYEDFVDFNYVKSFYEWGLISEPWTFVLDGDGLVAAKFGGPVSPRELRDAVTPLAN
jgi:hypothetical protein